MLFLIDFFKCLPVKVSFLLIFGLVLFWWRDTIRKEFPIKMYAIINLFSSLKQPERMINLLRWKSSVVSSVTLRKKLLNKRVNSLGLYRARFILIIFISNKIMTTTSRLTVRSCSKVVCWTNIVQAHHHSGTKFQINTRNWLLTMAGCLLNLSTLMIQSLDKIKGSQQSLHKNMFKD